MAKPNPYLRAGTSERGYGAEHQAERRRVAPLVEAGREVCRRCGLPIMPGEAWDLDHDDADRRRYLGPSHAACNRGAPNRRRGRQAGSREW